MPKAKIQIKPEYQHLLDEHGYISDVLVVEDSQPSEMLLWGRERLCWRVLWEDLTLAEREMQIQRHIEKNLGTYDQILYDLTQLGLAIQIEYGDVIEILEA